MKVRKKLIEVALPLDAINAASVREKSIRHGHPSTLHLWWARRPLAAARAVIFSQMVDDPSTYVDVLLRDPKIRRRAESTLRARRKVWEEAKATSEASIGAGIAAPEPGPEPRLDEIAAELDRERLFAIIRDLVLWENTANETVLQAARDEIWQSWRRACADNADHSRAREFFDRNVLPGFHDPFAGGGTLPLEAQRLGLESLASDLNPVAVLICKAMIEIPPKFAGAPPVNPYARGNRSSLLDREWTGARGLAEDVRYYGQWMRDQAEARIGHLYPKVEITAEMARDRPDLIPYVGHKLTVIAWLWARTVKSPNPAFADVAVPLASTFMLSTKPGTEAYVEAAIDEGDYSFAVRVGSPKDSVAATRGTKLARGANFLCLMSGTPIDGEYIKREGRAGRMGERLMAIVAEGEKHRVFLSPSHAAEEAARQATPSWKPDLEIAPDPRALWTPPYGLTTFGDLFSARQLVALDTFCDLVREAREVVRVDASIANLTSDAVGLDDGGAGAEAYADAIAVYLGLGVGRSANYWSGITLWGKEFIVQTFGRQAIPMAWDHAEGNPFSDSTGNWTGAMEWIQRVIETALPASKPGMALQADAQTQSLTDGRMVSTDPPYYDNIGYADLSDFFYVWLRRALGTRLPSLFSTLGVPKAEELVAIPYRQGSKAKAEVFFLNGMTQALRQLTTQAHPGFPLTIYYAFKQAESRAESGTVSTGWETFLEAVIQAGLSITGTWPIRTERDQGLKTGTNVLASSIILVCRPHASDTPVATRREFLTALQFELPEALLRLQSGNVAPVDLAQAAIGPGMAIYTRFASVLDAEGQKVRVREALALINRTLDEALEEQEGDFDADSRWALTWFEQSGFAEGTYGLAEQLSKSKNTSVAGMVDAGFLHSGRGKVRLLRPEELPADWDPATDRRLTAWEIVNHLIRVLEASGEGAAAGLVAKLGAKAENARQLCYRLYTICERKSRAAEALSYNGLVQSWPEIMRLARERDGLFPEQSSLFADSGGD